MIRRMGGLSGVNALFALHIAVILVAIAIPAPMSHSYLQLTRTPLAHLLQWDAQWYTTIAKYGYEIPQSAQHAFQTTGNVVPLVPLQATAFFPLLPFIVHIIGPIGALIVGNLVFYVTLVLIYRIFSDYTSEERAMLGVALYALNPTLVYESALYTESYTILFSLLVFYGIRQSGKSGHVLACVAGFLATFTHELGILLGIFALRYLREKQFLRMWTFGLSVISGWAVFCVYLSMRFGQPFAMFHAVKAWKRSWAFPGWNWVMSVLYFHSISIGMVLVGVILVVTHVWKIARQDTTWVPTRKLSLDSTEVTLWLIGGLLIGLCTYIPHAPLTSVFRLLSVLWPMYAVVSIRQQSQSRSVRWIFVILVVFILYALLGTVLYVHGHMFE